MSFEQMAQAAGDCQLPTVALRRTALENSGSTTASPTPRTKVYRKPITQKEAWRRW